jgi:hypothetical protein
MSKTHNNGTWTPARFNSFVKGALRGACSKWGPISTCKRAASTRRGFYRCCACQEEIPATLPSVYASGKKKGQAYRRKNAIVDHIEPIVPTSGWVGWDSVVERMFVEVDGLQLMCHKCHQLKCAEERKERKHAQ